MRNFLCFFISLFFLSSPAVYADRGLMPFKPGVDIFEPTQRAMIAWNGEEEILVLSTDLYASEPTRILEILPLPSEPVVKKGDVEVFRKAVSLINNKLAKERYVLNKGFENTQAREAENIPAGEVTFHEKIGAHDISVTHVLDKEGFVEWVEKYLKSAGVDNPIIPEPLKEVVAEYLKDRFGWFVFDVVELDNKPKTNEAIQYRFATNSLFFPLKITRTAQGVTSIELLILTPYLLSGFHGIPEAQVNLLHEPIDISSGELRGLNQDMAELLGYRQETKLRIWRIEGKLSSFDKDLIADWQQ